MSLDMIGRPLLAPEGQEVPRERIALALRAALGNARSPAKVLARITGRTPKAADRWLNAENDPSLASLIMLCRAYDDVWVEFPAMCGRSESDAEALVAEFQRLMTERRSKHG